MSHTPWLGVATVLFCGERPYSLSQPPGWMSRHTECNNDPLGQDIEKQTKTLRCIVQIQNDLETGLYMFKRCYIVQYFRR